MKYLVALAYLCGSLYVWAAKSPQVNISTVLGANPSIEAITQTLKENGDLMPYDDPVWLHVLDYLIRQSELPQYSHPNVCLNQLNNTLSAALLQFATRNYPAAMTKQDRETVVFGDTLNYNDRLRLIVAWNQVYKIDPMQQLETELSPDPIVDILTTCSGINAPIGDELWRSIYSQKHCALLTPATVNTSFKAGGMKIAGPLLETLNRCWSTEEKLTWGLPTFFELVGDKRYFDSENIEDVKGFMIGQVVKAEVLIFSLQTWLLKSDTENVLSSDKKYQSLLKEAKGDMAFLLWLHELHNRNKIPKDWNRYCYLSDPFIKKELKNQLKRHGMTCEANE